MEGWADGRMHGGSAGLTGTFEREMTSEREGPQPTRRNNLPKVPHLSEGPM